MWWNSIRFELLELLGEGSQGAVYKALRSDRGSGLKQIVAIKILHSRIAVSLWRHEFESLAKVRSNYCVQVFSFERYRRRPALVLEFVEGLSLARLGQICWLDSNDIDELIAQLERALQDLHRQHVFHGDLSPQNVLLDVTGRVRVLDFGLANGSGEQARVTPRFAAPERMRAEPSSAAADLFSLGKVEEFLRGGEVANSPYLHADPLQRRFQDFSPCSERQKALAEKVNALLQRQNAEAGRYTQTQNLKRQKPWSIKALVLGTITSLLVLATSSASQAVRPRPQAWLTVRTKFWHYFYLNGHPLGYSPLSVSIEAGENSRLRWLSASGSGELTLSLKPQENRLLEDSDFSH